MTNTRNNRGSSERTARRPSRTDAARSGARTRTRQSSFMKYANDNRFVQAVHGFTTGPYRAVFYGIVVVLALVSIYLPVRDLYIAHRTNYILTEQLAIRQKYNDALQKEVDSYLSTEGIEDAARRDFGMVSKGERPITVTGVDENNDPVSKDEGDGDGTGAQGDDAGKDGDASDADASDDGGADGASADDGDSPATDKPQEPSTSAEVEDAERAVFENSPWYYKVLDALFFFSGTGGQAVVSTGASGSSAPSGSSGE